MTALAVMLIAIGIADAVRRLTRRTWVPPLAAPLAVALAATMSGLWHLGDLVLMVIAAAAAICWVTLGARAERSGRHQGAPLAVFGAALTALILLSGLGSEVGGLIARWAWWVAIPGIADMSPTRLLMIVAVVLLQFVTGNQLVHLVLGSVGAVKPEGQPQPSDRLKGGRIGIDEVTEYFLVGSFASWIIALGGLALTQ